MKNHSESTLIELGQAYIEAYFEKLELENMELLKKAQEVKADVTDALNEESIKVIEKHYQATKDLETIKEAIWQRVQALEIKARFTIHAKEGKETLLVIPSEEKLYLPELALEDQ